MDRWDELERWLCTRPHGRKVSASEVLVEVRRLASENDHPASGTACQACAGFVNHPDPQEACVRRPGCVGLPHAKPLAMGSKCPLCGAFGPNGLSVHAGDCPEVKAVSPVKDAPRQDDLDDCPKCGWPRRCFCAPPAPEEDKP